jgi:hypothetical protein
MALNDIYQARFKTNVAKQPCQFTLHWRQDNSGTVATDNGCAALADLIAPEFANFAFPFGSDFTYEGFKVRKLNGTPLPPSATYVVNATGSQPTECIPAFKCCLVRLTQTTGMARHNGRCFLSGISEGSTTGNRITNPVAVTGIQTIFENVRLLSGSIGGVAWAFQMVVVEQRPTPATPYVYHDVGPISVQTIIYSQRRRSTRELGFVAA